MDTSDQNSVYENRRQAVIDDLKERLSSSAISDEERELFTSVIDALEELTAGVNSAHVRIALRKQELAALSMKMTELASAIRDVIDGVSAMEDSISAKLEAQNRANRRFYLGCCMAGFVIIGFMAYISFGSRETLDALGGLTQALKLVDVII